MLLQTRNLTKIYPKGKKWIKVLKGIHLDIDFGEFVVIMGPSGSGKSTLCSILACLMPATKGVLKIRGKQLDRLSADQLARIRNRTVGFVFQDSLMLDNLNVRDNLLAALIYKKYSRSESERLALKVLDRVGLKSKFLVKPKTLSGGERQRVAIARAMITNPDIIFADEPCSALDEDSRMDVLHLLQDLNAEGKTIVMITHSAQDAAFGKRILRIESGFIGEDHLILRPRLSEGGIGSLKSELPKALSVKVRSSQIKIQRSSEAVSCMELLAASKEPNALRQAEGLILALSTSPVLARLLEILKKFSDGPSGPTKVLDILFNFLKSSNWRARLTAVRALNDFKERLSHALTEERWALFFELLKDEVSDIRFESLQILTHLGLPTDRVAEIVEVMSQDKDSRIRAFMAQHLASEGLASSHAEVLLQLMKDSDLRVVSNAIEAYSGSVDALEHTSIGLDPLTGALREHLQSYSHRVKSSSAVALFATEPELSRKAIVELLESPSPLHVASGVFAASSTDPSLIEERIARLVGLSSKRVLLALNRAYRRMERLETEVTKSAM